MSYFYLGFLEPENIGEFGKKLILWIIWINSCLFTAIGTWISIKAGFNFISGIFVISLITVHILAFNNLREKKGEGMRYEETHRETSGTEPSQEKRKVARKGKGAQ